MPVLALVQRDVRDALTEGLRHVASEQHGARELADGGDDQAGAQRQRAAAPRRREVVGAVVGADAWYGMESRTR